MVSPKHTKNNDFAAQSPSKSANNIENVHLPEIPEDQLGRSLQSQNNGDHSQKPTPVTKKSKKVNNFTSYGDKNIDCEEIDIEDIPETENRNANMPPDKNTFYD